ncbi:MAG: 50S ribosomal protein L21 [Spirochaetes bacterium]|nr:MAG: 50S ribosomal protein L21 [Spirochaetota bacterium]
MMYSIVEINNKQYMAEIGKPIRVDHLNAEPNTEILIDRVLLYRTDNEIKIGTPYIEGLKLKGKVLGVEKGKKIRVFKYKRRKDYRKTIGSRPLYSVIQIEPLQGGK